jgi:hypothetical protein
MRLAQSGLEQMPIDEVLEHVNVPSYVIDAAGVIRWLNRAAEVIVGDARGRQFFENFRLARSQAQLRMRMGLLDQLRDLAEHTDDVLPLGGVEPSSLRRPSDSRRHRRSRRRHL